MPLYDYRCPQGHHFERMAPMSGGTSQVKRMVLATRGLGLPR